MATKNSKRAKDGKKDKGKKTETSEIDDLFNIQQKQKPTDPQERKTKPKTKSKEDKIRFGDPKGEMTAGAARRYTDDGLPIYQWHEIVSLEGGDTPDCPFDCACCY